VAEPLHVPLKTAVPWPDPVKVVATQRVRRAEPAAEDPTADSASRQRDMMATTVDLIRL
jgi:hypothetical protein